MVTSLRLPLLVGWWAALAAGGAMAAEPDGPPPALVDLSVLAPPGAAGPLTPAFSPEITEYTLSIAGDVGGIAVVPRAADGSARITVDGLKAPSGVPISLCAPVGESRILVAVASQGGASATYSISVQREDLQPLYRKFRKLTFTDPSTGITMGYRLFVPEGYDPAREYPLVLFLHGAGERGEDNEAQLTVGQGAVLWARPAEQAARPCLVLAPQSQREADLQQDHAPGGVGWTSLMSNGPVSSEHGTPFEPQAQLDTAYDLLRKVMEEFRVDPRRVYLTGMSMGGYGALAMAVAHPGVFAAVVPVCGGGDPRALKAIARTPMWLFHAEQDPVVPVQASRDAVQAVRAAGGAARYTEYPRGTFFYPDAHHSWTAAYADPELRAWLFSQSRAGSS